MTIFLRTTPHHMQQKVFIDTSIQIQFMLDVNALTVNEKTVVLFNLDSQKSEIISLKYKSKILDITPSGKLQPETHYQVDIIGGNDGVQDVYGTPLPQTYSFEFETADTPGIKAPTILSPVDLSQVQGNLNVSWSPVSEAYFYEIQISRSNIFDAVDWPAEGHRIYETSVAPDLAFQAASYFIRVCAVSHEGHRSAYSKVIRLAFIAAAPVKTTGPETGSALEVESLKTMLLDATEPTDNVLKVQLIDPKDHSVHMDLGISPVVTITFSDVLDLSSITADSIYLAEEKN